MKRQPEFARAFFFSGQDWAKIDFFLLDYFHSKNGKFFPFLESSLFQLETDFSNWNVPGQGTKSLAEHAPFWPLAKMV